MNSGNSTQWLFSRSKDLFILFFPVWACWLVAFILPESALHADLPLWFWVVFILGIDVSHVWSTIFRTYLDREEFSLHRRNLILVPVISLTVCFAIAVYSEFAFWRILAYIALFHFIKQQYGFLALYQLKSKVKPAKKFFKDKWVIYYSMLYPVFYWHLNAGRKFNWFIENDFLTSKTLGINPEYLQDFLLYFNPAANTIYWLVLGSWLVEELLRSKKQNITVSKGKILWVLTTAINWYLGIVWFNSDVVFSLTNVVAHGIPYMALIFFYVNRKQGVIKNSRKWTLIPQTAWILVMLAGVLFLAAGEEYLWDMLLYRERSAFFSQLFAYPAEVLEHPLAQALAIALLSLPQVSHYMIDGFIWKGSSRNPYLKKIFS